MAHVPDWLTAQPIAHRGFHHAEAGVIENTLTAVHAAAERGFGIEIDVQLSLDGEAMVFHDGNLARLTGQDRKIDNLVIAELKSIPLNGTTDRIPTLWETLQAVRGRVPVFVEIKNDDPVRRDDHLTQRTLEVIAAYQGPVAVMSFDPNVVADVRAKAPHLPRGIIADATNNPRYYGHFSPAEQRSRRHLLHAMRTMPDFVAYNVRDLPAPGPSILNLFFGCPVLTWTVRTEQDRRRASTYANQIIFEGFDPRVA